MSGTRGAAERIEHRDRLIAGSNYKVSKQRQVSRKKRGDRASAPRFWGGLGEATFFASLALLGVMLLSIVVTLQVTHTSGDQLYLGWFRFSLAILIGVALIFLGAFRVIATGWFLGTSVERRSALAKRASGMELISDSRFRVREYPNVPTGGNITDSPGIRYSYRLPISRSPVWRFFLATAIAMGALALASVLVILAIENSISGKFEWLVSVAAVIFLCGAGISIYYFAYELFLQIGIGPTIVEISEHPLYPGCTFQVFLSQTGRLMLRRIEFVLVCEEEATYNQGTNFRSEANRVFRKLILRETKLRIDPDQPFQRSCEVTIPSRAMHSFQAPCNTVRWKLAVRGVAIGWSKFERRFPVVVYPGNPKAGNR